MPFGGKINGHLRRHAVSKKLVTPLAGTVLLLIRGWLLWIVVPLSAIAWGLTLYWQIRKGISLGLFLGWIDNNFVIILERSLLLALFPETTHSWVAFTDITTVQHRIGHDDFF